MLSDTPKSKKSFSKYTDRLLQILQGDHKISKSADYKLDIASALTKDDILTFILSNITLFTLELIRKLFKIFLLCLCPELENHIIENIDQISTLLITPISSLDLDLLSGQFLRDLMQNPPIYASLLSIKTFNHLIEIAASEIFEISSDACVSIRALFEYGDSSGFINSNHVEVLQGLYTLCDTGYYSQRIALNLLYTTIKNETNHEFIASYVENEENLKYAMLLMKEEKSLKIKIEGFYLFCQQTRIISKRFDKELLPAGKIIYKNREKIIKFIEKFEEYREDETLQSEKREILRILKDCYND